jgi:serine/threonine protein kinase
MDSDFYKGDFSNIFPTELASFMQRCTNSNPESRPQPSELLCNLWINDMNVRGIYNLNDFYKLEDTKQKMY